MGEGNRMATVTALQNIKVGGFANSFDIVIRGRTVNFVTYPADKNQPIITIQSETRIGQVNTLTGEVKLTKSLSHHPSFIAYQIEAIHNRLTTLTIDPVQFKPLISGKSYATTADCR